MNTRYGFLVIASVLYCIMVYFSVKLKLVKFALSQIFLNNTPQPNSDYEQQIIRACVKKMLPSFHKLMRAGLDNIIARNRGDFAVTMVKVTFYS